MNKYYVTFGQVHVHRVNGKTFDCDCVAVIEAETEKDAREKSFDYFGSAWCFIYNNIEKLDMEYFPRGLMEVC